MRKLTLSILLLAASSFVFFSVRDVPRFVNAAYALDDWRSEFDEICAKTQDSSELSTDELKSLVERCDKLRQRIEKLDESQRKVYLKRLQMCRDLFAFVLESKEKK